MKEIAIRRQLSAVNIGSTKACSTLTQQAKSMFGAVRVLLSVVALPPYASILVNGSHVHWSPLVTPPEEKRHMFVLHLHYLGGWNCT